MESVISLFSMRSCCMAWHWQRYAQFFFVVVHCVLMTVTNFLIASVFTGMYLCISLCCLRCSYRLVVLPQDVVILTLQVWYITSVLSQDVGTDVGGFYRYQLSDGHHTPACHGSHSLTHLLHYFNTLTRLQATHAAHP